jgi:endo-1,4-beta-D-glucanase Y
VRLNDGQTFSNFLDARKQQMDISLVSATVISWACTNAARIQPQDSNDEHLEGFVHASTLIRSGSLRRVLPEKQTTDAGEIVEVTFQEVHPCPGKHYMYHPTIRTFLEKTSLDPLVSDKRKRVDYRRSSANNLEIIQATT